MKKLEVTKQTEEALLKVKSCKKLCEEPEGKILKLCGLKNETGGCCRLI